MGLGISFDTEVIMLLRAVFIPCPNVEDQTQHQQTSISSICQNLLIDLLRKNPLHTFGQEL